MRRILLTLFGFFVSAAALAAATEEQLPDIGNPANMVWTQDDEHRIGLMIVKGLRDSGQILEDPETTEYLQSIGERLASHAQDGRQQFQFFIVKDERINAFALPGGFIGVNVGLLLATENESELAGVLAHEIAHVTQRHLARRLQAQSKSSLVTTAAMLAAILIGATTGMSGDAMQGAIAVAQGTAAQQALNFTRANEIEADRVGMSTLVGAGFDPKGMPAFFETMSRRTGPVPNAVPEILQSHPVSSNRIAESRNRAAQYDAVTVTDAPSYALSRERLRVVTLPDGTDARAYYDKVLANVGTMDDAHRYGKALSLMAAGSPEEAIPILQGLSERNDNIIQYRCALGQAQMQAGETKEALSTFQRALELNPRNVPLTVRYGEALLRADQPKRAHEVLLDLFNVVPPTPDQCKLIARAANSAGDVADSYSYMAEYHVMNGELMLAINQLQLALGVPNLTEVQRARFQARLDQLREYMPRGEARVADREHQPLGGERQ